MTNSFSVFRVPHNVVIMHSKTLLPPWRKPPSTTSTWHGAAIPHPDMPIRHNGDNPARRGSRNGATHHHRSPSAPPKTCRCDGQQPTTPLGPPKDRHILQPSKMGRLLRGFQNGSNHQRHRHQPSSSSISRMSCSRWCQEQ